MIERRRRISLRILPKKRATLTFIAQGDQSHPYQKNNVSDISESTPAQGETTTAIAFDHTLTYAYATYAYIHILKFGIQIEQFQREQLLQYSRFITVILLMKQSMKKDMVQSVEEAKAGAKVFEPVNPAEDVVVDRAVDPVDSAKVDLEPASQPLPPLTAASGLVPNPLAAKVVEPTAALPKVAKQVAAVQVTVVVAESAIK